MRFKVTRKWSIYIVMVAVDSEKRYRTDLGLQNIENMIGRKFNISAATFFNQVSRVAGQQTDRSRVLSVAGNSTVALER